MRVDPVEAHASSIGCIDDGPVGRPPAALSCCPRSCTTSAAAAAVSPAFTMPCTEPVSSSWFHTHHHTSMVMSAPEGRPYP